MMEVIVMMEHSGQWQITTGGNNKTVMMGGENIDSIEDRMLWMGPWRNALK
jgi:hypothetical protein